jgi:hypothetical protein
MMCGYPEADNTVRRAPPLGSGSYFFVDRPPGQYAVTLDTPLVPGRFAATVTVKAAGTYYLKVAPRAEHWFIGAAVGVAGQVLEASIQENSGAYSITAMDPRLGATVLAEMKSPGQATGAAGGQPIAWRSAGGTCALPRVLRSIRATCFAVRSRFATMASP